MGISTLESTSGESWLRHCYIEKAQSILAFDGDDNYKEEKV